MEYFEYDNKRADSVQRGVYHGQLSFPIRTLIHKVPLLIP